MKGRYRIRLATEGKAGGLQGEAGSIRHPPRAREVPALPRRLHRYSPERMHKRSQIPEGRRRLQEALHHESACLPGEVTVPAMNRARGFRCPRRTTRKISLCSLSTRLRRPRVWGWWRLMERPVSRLWSADGFAQLSRSGAASFLSTTQVVHEGAAIRRWQRGGM